MSPEQLLRLLLITCSLVATKALTAEGPLCSLRNGQNAIYFAIPENTTQGSVLRQLPIVGETAGVDPSISLRLVQGRQWFQLTDRKELELKKRVDRDSGFSKLTAMVECTSNVADDSFQVNITVHVIIQDVNDNIPQFNATVYNAEVQEEVPIGTTVFTAFIANDSDQDGPNSEVHYSIEDSSKHSKYFSIPVPWEARVVTAERIDFEQIKTFAIRLRAKDLGTPSQSSTADLQINVLDTDDMNPAFAHERYTAVITQENLNMNEPLHIMPQPIRASDLDTMDDKVLYSITGDGSSSFVIRENGTILIKDHKLPTDSFQLTVHAQQANRPERRAQAILTVASEGSASSSEGPVFDEDIYRIDVAENAPNTTHLLQVRAVVPHKVVPIYYKLVNAAAVPFAITRLTGELTVNGEIDYEQRKHYEVLLEATDGWKTASASVDVSVLNTNDCAPKFETDNYIFNPASERGAIVGIVHAEDQDAFDRVTYALLNHNDVFFIDSSSGLITVSSSAAYKRNSTYELVVQASDSGAPPLLATMTVHVNFANTTVALLRRPSSSVLQDEDDLNAAVVIISSLGGAVVMMIIVIALLTFYIQNMKHKPEGKQTSDTMTARGPAPTLVIPGTNISISGPLDAQGINTVLRRHTRIESASTDRYSSPTSTSTADSSPHGSQFQSPLAGPCVAQRERSLQALSFTNPALLSPPLTLPPPLPPINESMTAHVARIRSRQTSSTGLPGQVPEISPGRENNRFHSPEASNVASLTASDHRPPLTVYF